jgi:hypothetical protein
MESSISEDDMLIDQLVLEPSSSTESARTAPAISKRPSMDCIYNYFSQNGQTGAQRRSLSKDMSSKNDPSYNGEIYGSSSSSKKSKHRISRKTFWGKKMFGSNSDIVTPTSSQSTPNGINYDSAYYQTMNDYEETRGKSQIFGIPLESAVSVARVCDQYELPAIIHRCIEYVETKNGLLEEGIYRLSGSSALVKKLKKRFNEGNYIVLYC